MSLENQILDKENNKNLSEKENVNVISNSNILDNNNNKINMTIKEKEEKNNNSNISSNKMKKNNENINKNKNEEKNNSILSNNKDIAYSQSSSNVKEGEHNSNNKNKTKNKDLSNLEINYMEMSKQLEELRHESSFLKNKLNEISKKQKNFSRNNKNVGNTISFNKATFINIKKLKNIRYDDSGGKNNKNMNTYHNKNLQRINSSDKIKLPIFKTFFENSYNKRNSHMNLNINRTFINDIQNKILYSDANYLNNNDTIRNPLLSLKKNFLLNKDHPTKLFPPNNLLFTKLDSKNNNYNNLENEISVKDKLIKKLNNNLIEQNKLAEEKISLLLKNKNKINERLNLIQKEKDEYKNKKESEIKQYMNNLKTDNKIIKELYNEKNKLMKSKRESELLNEKLRNIILEKRNELNNLYKAKKFSFDFNSNQTNNKYIKNIQQKYNDINKENKEIKNKIIALQKRLGINHKKELNIKKYMHNIYTLSSTKKPKKPKHLRLLLTENKENIDFIDKNSNNEEIDGSFNFENNDDNKENDNIFQKKYHTENTNISNNDTININNEEIKIFNKYINIISENKSNQEKLFELQNELKQKNETIKNLEKKIKEDLVEKDTLLENLKKEKNELQRLLTIETQKTLKLKQFAEEEQKKHIKYKNKLENYKKKSKTEEKKKEKEESKKPDIDFFIYSNSPAFDENKNIAKLKEDIFKLKQLLDEEKNKNEILQVLSDNQKERHELVKNKYDKTKKLNENLMNKIKEKEFAINKEIKLENEALKKQLIITENKNEELKKTIKKLNDEIIAYKNNEKVENEGNNGENENIDNNVEINPINNIKGDKFRTEKKNYIGLIQKDLIQDKRNQRFSFQVTKPTFHGDYVKKPSDKKTIPKSNKDLLTPKFDKDKIAFYKEKKNKIYTLNQKNQKSLNSVTSTKIKSNLIKHSSHLTGLQNSDITLNLNNSDINKDNSEPEKENKIKIQRNKKRESSEKVLRIFNGNNINSSEFSSEKNFSENNKGTQIGISNVIKENDNEDEEEKFNSELGEIKGKNNNENNNNNISG